MSHPHGHTTLEKGVALGCMGTPPPSIPLLEQPLWLPPLLEATKSPTRSSLPTHPQPGFCSHYLPELGLLPTWFPPMTSSSPLLI